MKTLGRERGSATVLGLGALLLLITLLVALLALGAALHASLRARAAADAAALAGAAVLLEGGDTDAACEAAHSLARANGGEIEVCASSPGGETVTAVLRIEVLVPVPVLDGTHARAVARAGAVPVRAG